MCYSLIYPLDKTENSILCGFVKTYMHVVRILL